jgi:hypothetical protein
MNNLVELYLIYKLAKLLTQNWTDLPAYKLGIIDSDGKPLKKSTHLKTAQERNAYTVLHRFAFNLRRIIEALPGGKTKIAKYLAVYALFKEENLNSFDGEFLKECGDIDTIFQQYITEDSGSEYENI